jgi:hypothetical protein
MDIKYSDRVKQWSEGYPLIQRATSRLEEILEEDADHVSGEWDLTKNEKGQVVATLRLRDAPFEAVGKFEPDDLESPALTSFGLGRTWSQLLQARSDKMFKDLVGTGD